MQNKAQLEIMGLAVIVILISLALLFALMFVIKQPATKSTLAVKESILAADTLNTLLGTTTSCFNRNIKELLQDCALTGGMINCGGVSSCIFAQSQIQSILENSFGVWKKQYYFTIQGPYVENIAFGNACPGEKEFKSHPVPVRPGFDIVLKLEICT